MVVILLGLGFPNLLILLLKMCSLLKDLTLARVNNYVISDNLGFHLWPKCCGLAMTVLICLIHALPGSFLIASPEPTNDTGMVQHHEQRCIQDVDLEDR